MNTDFLTQRILWIAIVTLVVWLLLYRRRISHISARNSKLLPMLLILTSMLLIIVSVLWVY